MKPLLHGAATAMTCLAALFITDSAWGDRPRTPHLPPPKYRKKLSPMPDLCQTDARFVTLPNEGRAYCGPTAVANALLLLDADGFPDLVPGNGEIVGAQLDLLHTLGSDAFMATNPYDGTGPLAVMQGLDGYIQSRGYRPQVEWRGWRNGGPYSAGDIITEDWLVRGVLGDSNIILQIGWYDYDRRNDRFYRNGGHYLTLAGYDRTDPLQTVFWIHDPSRRSGIEKAAQEATLAPLPHGSIAAWKSYRERPARDYFEVRGIPLKNPSDIAILDGAIRFRVRR